MHRGLLIQSFKMSLENIISNKMRSFLTMLGIVIGVASVIGLITIVQGVSTTVMGQFSDLGAGTLTVNAQGTYLKRGLTDSDLNELRQVPGVEGISPTVSLSTSAVFGNTVAENVSVEGKDLIYFQQNDVVYSGRSFNTGESDGNVMVCIVDRKFVRNVMNGVQPIGNTVRLAGYDYQIIGVLKPSNSLTSAFVDTSNIDGNVIIPYRNALKMSGAANVTSAEVYVQQGAVTADVEAGLRTALDNIYNEADNSYSIFNMESLMDTMNTVQGMLATMLGGIASIALLVGGIGIMNMMLVSVTERTREIGLRKALGAEPLRIQLQFLIESVTLSMIGGIIGVAFGLLIAYIGARAMDAKFTMSGEAILLGVGFSAGVGILFGWAPARRASRLNPIDALRAE